MQPSYKTPWDKLKPWVITGLVMLVLGYVGYFIGTHGFIEITITRTASSQSVSLLNQKTNEKSVISEQTTSIRRFVSKSNFEVFVTGSEGSAWQKVHTLGFLQTTQVSVTPQPERSRSFVATDPRGCMNYAELVVSYTCGQQVSDVLIHQPSTSTTPPTITQGIDGLTGTIQSLVTTPGGTIALLQTYESGEEEGIPTYSLTTLAPGTFTPTGSPVKISAIDGSGEYYAKPYNKGFLVYKEDYRDLLFFSSIQASPERLQIPQVSGGYSAQTLSTSESSATILFRQDDAEQDNSLDKPISSPLIAVVYTPSQTVKQVALTSGWSNALPCGMNKICATSSDGERQHMSVLDISGSQPKELFRVNTVTQLVKSLPNGVLVATNQGLLRINTSSQSGSVDYSFGDFTLCGISDSINPSEYVLCITQDNQTSALLIQESADSNQIDKKVAALRKNKSVDTVTADRNNLFIVPNVGEDVYNEQEQLFLPDPAKVTAAQQAIQTQVGQLGLRDLGYNIVTY